MGGMFIKSGDPLEKGSELNLQFTLPNPVEKELRVKAEVVRIQNPDPDNPSPSPSGMGIRFLDLSDRDREAIEAFIKMKT
jgi:Tfp pilus assembly protein PilZ